MTTNILYTVNVLAAFDDSKPRLQGRIEVSVEALETKRRREDKDVLVRSEGSLAGCFCLVKRLLFLSRPPQPIKPEKHCSARLPSRFFKLVTWNYLSWSQPMSHSQHPFDMFFDMSKITTTSNTRMGNASFLRGFGLQALCPHG